MNQKDKLTKTKKVFGHLYKKKIKAMEAMEIIQNLNGFFELLEKIDNRNKLI